jgi:hypothetical protein
MASRLINVRLDDERLKKASKLRERGVVLSHLVREAIDTAYRSLTVAEGPRDVGRLIEDLFERYPDPPRQHAERTTCTMLAKRANRSASD